MGSIRRRSLNHSPHLSVCHSTEAMTPRPQSVNDLGYVEAVYRFGQGIIAGVTDSTNKGLDPREGQPFGMANGRILPTALAVMNAATFVNEAAIMPRCSDVSNIKSVLGELAPRQPTILSASASMMKATYTKPRATVSRRRSRREPPEAACTHAVSLPPCARAACWISSARMRARAAIRCCLV